MSEMRKTAGCGRTAPRSILAVLALMLLVMLFAACSAADPSENEANTGTVASSAGAEKETTPSTAAVQSEWGSWSAWSEQEVIASDSRQMETASMYRYYAFICPHCGARIPYQLSGTSYGICYETLDGCGATSGSVEYVLTYLSTPPSDATEWEYNKRYLDIDDVRWFISNGDEPVTVYRYRDK